MVSEEGVGEMVRLPLRLIAVLGFLEGNRHYPSIGDESLKLLFLAMSSFAAETTAERVM